MHSVRGAVSPPPPKRTVSHPAPICIAQSVVSRRDALWFTGKIVVFYFFFIILILLRRGRQACPSRHEELTTVVDVDGRVCARLICGIGKVQKWPEGLSFLPSFNASLSHSSPVPPASLKWPVAAPVTSSLPGVSLAARAFTCPAVTAALALTHIRVYPS